MSVIVFGTRCYGRVDAVPGAYISTTFGYLQFMPLLPKASYVFVTHPQADEPLAFQIPMHWRSVAAGLLRAWGPVLGLICAANFGRNPVVAIVGAALGAAATAWAWWLAPRVRERERLMRNVYSRWLGCPADAAAIGLPMHTTAARLRAALAERAEPFSPAHYREQPSAAAAAAAYREIALDPRMEDRAFLAAAITLCRIDEASAPTMERARLAATRGKIFDKLSALHPDGVAEPPTVEVMWDHPLVTTAPGGYEHLPDRRPAAPPLAPAAVARRKRIDRIAGLVAVGAAVAAIPAFIAWRSWLESHPKFYVWNASSTEEIEIEVDGEKIARLAASARDDYRLAVGAHRLRVLGHDDRVIEEKEVTVAASDARFWAPATKGRVCFFLEQVHYSARAFGPPPEPRLLDPSETLWSLGAEVDYFLQEPPESLEVRQGERIVKRALSSGSCDAD
jgi:hypothetical protein